jgi:hypothetical protein
MGVPVSNGVCVRATNNGKDALFVVGGTTQSPGLQSYSGLQWYTFQDQQWGKYTPPMSVPSVTQNRQMHGAAWLNSSSSILIYAGFQDDSFLPTDATFTISTSDYLMQAFSSSPPPPPVMSPILLPYNSSHAVMVGGSPENQAVWTFSEADGWLQMDNVTLPMGLPNTSYVQGALYDGSDGSKFLQLFKMSASPNTVTTLELEPPVNASAVSSVSRRTTRPWHSSLYTRPSRKRRRDTPLGSYPAYNATLASTTTRDGFSIAQDASGLVVIAGGVNPASNDPLSVFNQTSDAWINANQFFVGTTTPSPSPTTTSPSSASSSLNIAAIASGKSQTTVIIGSVLGAVFGFALFCVLIIFGLRCLRRRDRRRRLTGGKGEMDFTDRGVDFMASAGGSFSSSNHGANFFSQTSTTAVAAGGSPQPKRSIFHRPGDSNGSSKSIFARNKSPVIGSQAEPMITLTSPGRPEANTPSPEPRTQPRTDEGWSTYFQTNQDPTDLTRLPPGHTRYQIPSRDTQYTTTSQSDYTNDSRVVSSQPHASAEVPPLTVRGTFSNIAEDDELMEESSSGQESWTPIGTSEKGNSWDERPTGDRPPSSIYGDTGTYPHPGSRVRIPNFPVVPTSNRTSQHTVIPVHDVQEERGLRTLASKDFAGGLTTPAARRSPTDNTRAGALAPGLSLDVPRTKLSPRPAGDASGAHRGQRNGNEGDPGLSWLNLNVR